MTVTLIHTADWQVGKPFASTEDPEKRTLLQQERLQVIQRIGQVAQEQRAEFVVISGDLFDSGTVTKATVSATCSRIGALGLPVFAIPGNHDHGGAGSVWEQPFFLRERAQLAPNFQVLLEPAVVELENVILLPAPLLRRHVLHDTTAWIREVAPTIDARNSKPRVVIAHGSVQGFGGAADDDDEGASGATNQIDLGRLPGDAIDYIALGDWHGTGEVGPKAWYSGTPEQDRFSKGEQYSAGNVLSVKVERGKPPIVQRMPTGGVNWHSVVIDFHDDSSIARLETEMTGRIENRVMRDVARLELRGTLGLEAMQQLETLLEAWTARLLRLQVLQTVSVAPTSEEIGLLGRNDQDPLISAVARELTVRAGTSGEDAPVAQLALRELFRLYKAERGKA